MKQKQAFSSTISTNPYNDSFYTGTTTNIKVAEKPQYFKDQYSVSYLKTQDFITTQVAISQNIPDEDVIDAIENKVYEELGLDMAIEYQISYIEASEGGEDGNKNYHVFVVDPLSIDEAFAGSLDNIKYIDQITPVPLLIRSLYKKEIIEDSGTHCFIYFQNDDAFLTLYDDREFLYTKSLKYSFSHMHDRYCELLGEQIELSEFTKLLAEDGLRSGESENQQYLIKLFGEVFLHINDVMTYSKRAFELDRIDKVYIGSEVGAIVGMDEYSQTYLGLDSSDFDFNYGFETEEWYIDQIHLLMHLTAQLEAEDKYDCNFTRFHRPPPFVKRASGQLILTIAGAIVVAMIYPTIFWTLDAIEGVKKAVLSSDYRELHLKKVDRENQINHHTTEMEKIKTLVLNEVKALNDKKSVLTQIHDIKVNYPMKAKRISSLTKDLNKYKVKLNAISYTENETTNEKLFLLSLVSKKDKPITNLIEWYTKTKSSQYRFSIHKIEYNEDDKRYYSELKAVLK
ncbi:MAG: hypothetical protein COA44_04470 [Arcobacter sp.]|nr:MAG: hypothetical protein COA44_04470 [Arcobacter sp.]